MNNGKTIYSPQGGTNKHNLIDQFYFKRIFRLGIVPDFPPIQPLTDTYEAKILNSYDKIISDFAQKSERKSNSGIQNSIKKRAKI
jgi:hypothetical protein